MLIIVQKRNWIINSKNFEYVYLKKYYYEESAPDIVDPDGYYISASYVENHPDEYPDYQQYKEVWMIRTNHFAWQELGKYYSKEEANRAWDKLLNNRLPIFFMPKEE